MANSFRSPEELRTMFGANLRHLAQDYPSVSELCRQLGINRTQFNRYLSGESFPRLDVLDRICRFFDVDARILLKPLHDIDPQPRHPSADVLDHFLAARTQPALPAGFFDMTETHPQDRNGARNRLLFVRKTGQTIVLREYEPKSTMPGKPASLREVQGIVCRVDAQICILMSRRGGQDCRVMVISELPGADASRWSGHTTYLTGNTDGPSVARATTLVHLGDDLSAALGLCRSAISAARQAEAEPMQAAQPQRTEI